MEESTESLIVDENNLMDPTNEIYAIDTVDVPKTTDNVDLNLQLMKVRQQYKKSLNHLRKVSEIVKLLKLSLEESENNLNQKEQKCITLESHVLKLEKELAHEKEINTQVVTENTKIVKENEKIMSNFHRSCQVLEQAESKIKKLQLLSEEKDKKLKESENSNQEHSAQEEFESLQFLYHQMESDLDEKTEQNQKLLDQIQSLIEQQAQMKKQITEQNDKILRCKEKKNNLKNENQKLAQLLKNNNIQND